MAQHPRSAHRSLTAVVVAAATTGCTAAQTDILSVSDARQDLVMAALIAPGDRQIRALKERLDRELPELEQRLLNLQFEDTPFWQVSSLPPPPSHTPRPRAAVWLRLWLCLRLSRGTPGHGLLDETLLS
jgi:hypothetical protein